MRLGANIFTKYDGPEEFVRLHAEKGYSAAYCPNGVSVCGDTTLIGAYKAALEKANIVIAEVGAWCNPLSRDEKTAKEAVDHVISRLALADEIGAKACVNIIGTWHDSHWFAPAADNFSADFFDYAVEVSRKIIDAVKPKHTKMTFEIMPYSFLDSAAEYLRFLKALDRREAGVHFDPANCINCPRLYYDNAAFFKRELALIGDKIVSVHLKDLVLHPESPAVHLEEVPIGQGGLDYVSLLKLLNTLPKDTPVMLEHLPDEQAYDSAAENVRSFAAQASAALI